MVRAAAQCFLATCVLAAWGGCAGATGGEDLAPITLDIPRNALPSPGICRIWLDDVPVSQQRLPQACDGIEYAAPLGSRVLYRPADGSREVHVRYMSTASTGHVTGIDAFSIDTMRLVRVIMSYRGERIP